MRTVHLTLVLTLTACGDAAMHVESPPETTAQNTDEPKEDEELVCQERNWGCDDADAELDCDLPRPCEPLQVYDPEINGDGATNDRVSFQNPAAATCIFENLENRTRGLYVVQTEPGGQNNRSLRFQLIDEDTIWVTERAQEDDCRYGRQQTGTIADDAFLLQCKTSSQAQQYTCFDAVLTQGQPCVGPQSACL